MIPTIGCMIGGYIVFRCVDAICGNPTRFSSRTAQGIVQVMAWVGIIATAVFCVSLLASGSTSDGIR